MSNLLKSVHLVLTVVLELQLTLCVAQVHTIQTKSRLHALIAQRVTIAQTVE